MGYHHEEGPLYRTTSPNCSLGTWTEGFYLKSWMTGQISVGESRFSMCTFVLTMKKLPNEAFSYSHLMINAFKNKLTNKKQKQLMKQTGYELHTIQQSQRDHQIFSPWIVTCSVPVSLLLWEIFEISVSPMGQFKGLREGKHSTDSSQQDPWDNASLFGMVSSCLQCLVYSPTAL